jgi:flagellar hook protein FlgE
VQLASFINLRGLKPMRGNLWANSAESGAPTTHSPSEGGTGELLQGSLEIPPST